MLIRYTRNLLLITNTETSLVFILIKKTYIDNIYAVNKIRYTSNNKIQDS